MPVQHVKTPQEFAELMLKSAADGKLLVVDFSAAWCGPCKMIAPVFEKLSGQYASGAVCAKVDVDEVQPGAFMIH